jgi:hypothetical protein
VLSRGKLEIGFDGPIPVAETIPVEGVIWSKFDAHKIFCIFVLAVELAAAAGGVAYLVMF